MPRVSCSSLTASRSLTRLPMRPGATKSAIPFARDGQYSMHFNELEHACRVAWRGSARCIGRLPWQTLIVRDCRDHETPEEIFQACVDHLRLATNGGRIRPVMTVFAADGQTRRGPGSGIRN